MEQPTPHAARLVLWVAMILVGGSVAAAGTWQYNKRRADPASAFLSIEAAVPGVDVTRAEKPLGRTPAGDGAAAGDASAGGPQLRIETQPSAMMVSIDGVDRGRSPLALTDLEPGPHDIAVRGEGRTLRNRISLGAGERALVVFASDARTPPPASPVAAAAAGGWLAVSSPVPVEIRESGRMIGSSSLDRLMLPAGDHALEFVNEPLGYVSNRTVRIEAGRTAGVQLERVNGVVSINALPWAEVWLDGARIGQTPLGNLSHPIGTYDVVLRHPQFGERRERVTITARQPARLGVDMRKEK